MPGVADLSLEANVGKPQIRIEVDRAELARHGMNAEEVLTIVRNGLGGEPVSVLLDGVKRFDIAVRLDDDTRDSIEALRRIPLKAASGALVPLEEVANVNVAEGYSFVRREQLQRYAVIQMDVRGRDVDGFVKEAAAAIEAAGRAAARLLDRMGRRLREPAARAGQAEPDRADHDLLHLRAALHRVQLDQVRRADPGQRAVRHHRRLLALFVTGQYLSVPSAIGFIAVFGVAMLNGIVLVSFLNEQRERGLSVREAVLQGTALRSAPGADDRERGHPRPGADADLQRRGRRDPAPLATVVVGGLLSSTLLTLILLPVLYEWLENRAERRLRRRRMKQIKAFVHLHRMGELCTHLEAGRFHRISIFDAKGPQGRLSGSEVEYSVRLGERVVSEAQITVFCEDEQVDAVVAIFQRLVRSTHRETGWLYVTPIEQSVPLGAALS
jgi:cobalt-zinc-cadmium resistance protein CzcA